MRTMRLKHIIYARFGLTEETNYNDLIKQVPDAANLGPKDLILFIAATENQLLFVHGFGKVTDGKSEHMFLRSERLRLVNFKGPYVTGVPQTTERTRNRGKWDPLMLADYGRAVGIRFEGLKTWEQHKAELLQKLRDTFAKADEAKARKRKRSA